MCVKCAQEYRPYVLKDGTCDRCIAESRETERRAEKQRQAAEAARKKIANSLGGERAYCEFTESRFVVTADNREAFDAARSFDPESDNLLLWGDCGVGKTHLACIIARRFLEQGIEALYIQPSRLVRKLRGKSGDEEQAEIDRLIALPVLVLDELGAEKDTEYAIQILYEVINGRLMAYRNGLVVTSNLSMGDLAQKLGDDRLPSRLTGICRVIPVGGDDWRQRGK